MTGCKMVEESGVCVETQLDAKFYASLEGTKHSACILVATKGALIVSLQIGDVIYNGVLIDISNSSKLPSFASLAKPAKESTGTSENSIVVVNANECDIPSDPDITTSACQFRHTYLSEHREIEYSNIIPSRNITSSIDRIHGRRRLRKRAPRAKLILCSMCKTHCFDTDNENSDKEGAVNLITPPIKISFNAPDGQNVMEIEPKYYKNPSHKRKHSKHKSKKHSKKSKHDDRGVKAVDKSLTVVQEDVLEEEMPSVATTKTTATTPTDGARAWFDDINDEDSDAQGLVIDIPGETSAKSKKKSVPINSNKNQGRTVTLPNIRSPQSTSSEAASEHLPKTKTKAHLRRQKITPKVSRAPRTAEPIVNVVESTSVVSQTKSRSVSTYESTTGKHISLGDVIWGKIVGFPWWPGRVCAITVLETQDNMILDHTADIDWYCSPTKSHLPCSAIYPFLEDFSKRFDKKKKTKSYTKAVNEAKCDAVLNEQYLEAMVEPEDGEETNTSPHHSPEQEHSQDQLACNSNTLAYHEPSIERGDNSTGDSCNTLVVKTDDTEGNDSPSLLIDAFLRTDDPSSTGYSESLNDAYNLTAVGNPSAAPHDTGGNNSNGMDGCLTISLPSPRSLLSSS